MASNISAAIKGAPNFRVECRSEADTLELARVLGRALRPGDWLAVLGELGAGKTVFVKGIAEALHCKDLVTSPTFVLIQSHMPKGSRCAFHHADLYRLKPEETSALDWEQLLSPHDVTAVEWAEKALPFWPPHCLPVRISHAPEAAPSDKPRRPLAAAAPSAPARKTGAAPDGAGKPAGPPAEASRSIGFYSVGERSSELIRRLKETLKK